MVWDYTLRTTEVEIIYRLDILIINEGWGLEILRLINDKDKEIWQVM